MLWSPVSRFCFVALITAGYDGIVASRYSTQVLGKQRLGLVASSIRIWDLGLKVRVTAAILL